MEKTIFYIGNFKSSKVDAQFQLVMGNSHVLRNLGYKVVLIGNDNNESSHEDILMSKKEIHGFDVYNVSFNKSISDIFKMWFIHNDIKKVISEYNKPEFIISYGSIGFAHQLHLLAIFCKMNKIPFLINSVELPSQEHGTKFERIIKKLDFSYIYWIIKNKADGIIAISSYICEYFSKFNDCPKVIIPPLKEYRHDTIDIAESEYLKIVYIGYPFPTDGRTVDEISYKDRLDIFVDALLKIQNQVPEFQFEIYGPTKEEYTRVVKRHQTVLESNGNIIFNGHVNNKLAVSILKSADFSVVFRKRDRMSMAGFSSKLVESITNGTPVILTDTSDYKEYLEDGKHAFFVDENLGEKLYSELISILNMSRNKLLQIRKNCLELDKFNYRMYTDKVKLFLSNVVSRKLSK